MEIVNHDQRRPGSPDKVHIDSDTAVSPTLRNKFRKNSAFGTTKGTSGGDSAMETSIDFFPSVCTFYSKIFLLSFMNFHVNYTHFP
jgi:hypothetical protein